LCVTLAANCGVISDGWVEAMAYSSTKQQSQSSSDCTINLIGRSKLSQQHTAYSL